jgi:hypothetical protein
MPVVREIKPHNVICDDRVIRMSPEKRDTTGFKLVLRYGT